MLRLIRIGIVAALAAASCSMVPTAPAQDAADQAQILVAVVRAGVFRRQSKLPEAAREFEKALALARRAYGPDDQATASLMNDLANVYRDLGRYADAEPLLQRGLEILEAKLGRDHPDVATGLINLAILYGDLGRYDDAEPLFKRCLAIREEQLGRDHLDVAITLGELATLYSHMGRYTDAEPLLKRGLGIMEAELGRDHPNVAMGLNNLAALYSEMGRYADAEPLFKRVLGIRERRLGRDHPDVAQSLNNLAALYKVMGRYADAEPLYKRSLAIQESKLGGDHPDVALGLNNLAVLYLEMGRYADAEPLHKRSLEIRERRLGRDHPDVAQSLNNLAALYTTMGRSADALSLWKRSLEIREKRLGNDHPLVALSLNNVALQLLKMGRSADAELLFKRSLGISEKRLGRDHPDVAIILYNLSNLYSGMGRYGDAEPLYQRSLAIREKQQGRDHPDVVINLNGLVNVFAALGRWDEAAGAVDRERRIVRRHVSRVLPALAEGEQLAFLKASDATHLRVALSVALERRDDAETVNRSAGWVLNGKAVAQEALAQRALLGRDRDDPNAEKLTVVRQQLAALTLAAPKPGQEQGHLREIGRLTAQERELSRQVGQHLGRPEGADPWVETDAVRRALPADAVLVEIARFDVANFRAKGEEKQILPPRYAAWVIPPAGKGAIRLIDLGAAEPIEEAVAAVRRAIEPDPAALKERGEPEVEAELRKPLGALADLVLKPLLPHIGGARHWVLSPDAALWLVPWAALPLDKERYAIEGHQIRYVVSGRDLALGAGKPATGQAVLMADPDFDLDPAAGRRIAREVVPDAKATADALVTRGVSRSLRLGDVPRLPGTAAEARAIAPKLQGFTGAEPVVYTGGRALEAAFKAFRRPRAVVMSTHGFFLDDQHEEANDRTLAFASETRSGPRPAIKSENPLLRCGLLLAGCNRANDDGDDGVLTGLEIVGTDLRGTELVVLSACETGVGEVHNGEGVAGLRQAFQLAGARTVVATLWQVPDKESARLMTGFFDELAAGKGKAEALHRAQLAQIESRRQRNGAAHPFFWAAYTVTGQER